MNTTREIHNGMDVIDSRDVIARIAELEDERQAASEELKTSDSTTCWKAEDGTAFPDDSSWDEDRENEFQQLKAFAEEGSGASDWQHGETFIRESYFEDYARELAEDIGAIKSDMGWPCTCIDWEKAADELKMDYSSAEFGDVTYYYRS